ncbi:MAG: hypothetical protein Q7T19_05550 [Caulobacter sp.]|nr:hypothetical protein [Caulobacter sp.]
MIPPDRDAEGIGPEHQAFLDLVEKLPPDWRRVVGVLLRRVAHVEAEEGETAALMLIDDINSIIVRPETTH